MFCTPVVELQPGYRSRSKLEGSTLRKSSLVSFRITFTCRQHALISTHYSALAPQQPVLALNETVPFRLTPNMQDFITENGMEGLLVTGINAIARCLTEPEVS